MSNLVVVQLTDDIQHVQLTDDMIQRSFDRYEIESDEEELQVDYTAGNMNQRSAGNMNQRSIEIDEEEYWYSVEQERMKEEYWHLVEQLELEYGANIPTEDHGLILNTTLSIILEIELDDKQELDDESFKKMICNIYPEVCELYCILDSLYQL